MLVLCTLVAFQGGYYAGAVCAIGIVSIAMLVVFAVFRKTTLMLTFPTWFLTIIALAYLASALAHGAAITMLQESATWFVLAGMSLWCACDAGRDKRRMLDALAVAGSILAAVGVVMFCGLLPLEGAVNANRLMFTFQYANASGLFFAVVALVCLHSDNRRLRIAAVLPVVALLLTKSVGSLAVFVAALVIAGVYALGKGRIDTKVAVGGGLAVALVCVAAIVAFPGRFAQAAQTFVERIIQALDALTLIPAHFALGIGPDQWQFAYPTMQTAQYRATDVHCSYLQIALDAGVLAALLFMAMLVSGAVRLFKQGDFACGLCVSVMAVHALVDFDFQFGALVFLAAMLLAGKGRKKVGSAPVNRAQGGLAINGKTRAVLSWCFALCALACSCGGVYLDMRAGAVQNAAARADAEMATAMLDSSRILSADPSMQACLSSALFAAGDYEGVLKATADFSLPAATVDFQRLVSCVQLGKLDTGRAIAADMLHKRPYDIELYDAVRELVVEAELDNGFAEAFNAEAVRANELAVSGHAAWLSNQETIDLIDAGGEA